MQMQKDERRHIDRFLSLAKTETKERQRWMERTKRQREGDDIKERRVTDNMDGFLTGTVGPGQK